MRGAETRERLQHAALATLREDGIAGLSARGVARRAEVNQALIFYHYGGLFDLLEQAATASVVEAIARYQEQFQTADTFTELLAVGRRLHEQERAAGNVAVMYASSSCEASQSTLPTKLICRVPILSTS